MRTLFTIALVLVLTSCQAPGKKTPDAQGSPATSSAVSAGAAGDEFVWVGKSDEAKSCESDGGIELYTMENDLKTAGVKVLDKKKFHDNKMRIQMCGADKGTWNGFRISKKDVDKAKTKGFELLPGNVAND